MKPALLDLYCKAGGAGMGYCLEFGCEIVGVDKDPQKRYPFHFVQADALTTLQRLMDGYAITAEIENGYKDYYLSDFFAIHASPPCQKHSAMTKGRWKDRLPSHPDLIAPTRELLIKTGLPYIIENVVGAPLINPVMLCGTMFNLQSKAGNPLYRHRLFETSFQVGLTPPCSHSKASAIGVYGGGQNPARKRLPAVAVYGHSGGTSKRGNATFGIDARREAMGIGWMTGEELSQAIPPAYTQFVARFIPRKEGRS